MKARLILALISLASTAGGIFVTSPDLVCFGMLGIFAAVGC